MKPTRGWMSQAFNEYNKKYFGGKLEMPYFSNQCDKRYWGYYMPDGNFTVTRRFKKRGRGTIYLNGLYSREEKDWISTLLHEMTHMYINEILGEYPFNAHGKRFMEIANRINRDGWNIAECTEQKNTDVKGGGDDEMEYDDMQIKPEILCVISQPQDAINKVWGFRAENSNLNDYINTAKTLKQINGATNLSIYYCYTDKLKSMPTSPTTLVGVGSGGVKQLLYKLKQLYGCNLNGSIIKLVKTIDL